MKQIPHATRRIVIRLLPTAMQRVGKLSDLPTRGNRGTHRPKRSALHTEPRHRITHATRGPNRHHPTDRLSTVERTLRTTEDLNRSHPIEQGISQEIPGRHRRVTQANPIHLQMRLRRPRPTKKQGTDRSPLPSGRLRKHPRRTPQRILQGRNSLFPQLRRIDHRDRTSHLLLRSHRTVCSNNSFRSQFHSEERSSRQGQQ